MVPIRTGIAINGFIPVTDSIPDEGKKNIIKALQYMNLESGKSYWGCLYNMYLLEVVQTRVLNLRLVASLIKGRKK